MSIVIFHNPDCGTSRNVLQVIRDAGYDPTVIEYLQTGWSKPQLQALFAAANLTPREALRVSKSPAEALGLLEEGVSDAQLLDAMVAHPVLVNRPIVSSPKGVRLCRPSEAVLDLLARWPAGPYAKSDGTLMIDADGKRVQPVADPAGQGGEAVDYNTISADDFGAGLRGIGLNLLVRDVAREVAFLGAVFGMKAFQPTADFAIMTYGDQVFQLHSDGTYHSNPLLGLLPESPPRGAGIEIRLYDSDPEEVCALAEAAGGTILQEPTDKPHGLREAYVLCENGYAWVASRAR